MTAVGLRSVVDNTDLPEYPIDAAERLQSHFFVEFHFRRWLNSEARLLADWDVRGVMVDLIMIAQDQTPVGTLPKDPKLIAKMLGMSVDQLHLFCARDVSPLRGWVPCMAGGQVRLMHPVVTEIAEKAIGSRRDREAEKARRATAKALKDLDARLRAMGCTRQADDRVFVERVDHWLAQNCVGNRTEPMIREALDAVSRSA